MTAKCERCGKNKKKYATGLCGTCHARQYREKNRNTITKITEHQVCGCGTRIVTSAVWEKATAEARKGFYEARKAMCKPCYEHKRKTPEAPPPTLPVETIPDTELHPEALKVRELLRRSRQPKSHNYVTRISERWTR